LSRNLDKKTLCWSRNLDKNPLITRKNLVLIGIGMDKSATLLLVLFFLTASCLIKPLPAKAESRTIVVPDDYPTISSAIGNATDGDTIFVKKGTYEENPLKINKTLSLIGEGADSTKISFDPPYTDVTISIYERYRFYEEPIKVYADGFRMSGFTIVTTGGYIVMNGNGTRITDNKIAIGMFVQGSYLNILENTFSAGVSMSGSYCNISGNNMVGSGIWIREGLCNIISSNNIKGGGIEVEGGASCLIYDNNLTGSPYGSFSVSGNDNIVSRNIVDHLELGLKVSGLNNLVFSNRITHCGEGLYPGAGNTYFANYVANNLWGIYAEGVVLNPLGNLSTIYHNNFIGNTYQVTTFPREYETDYFDNGKEGNYWSDYAGTDADGDGIGDTPYVIDANRSDRYPLMAPFDIDSVIVELPEWASSPIVRLISPENTTYTSANVTLNFTVNKQTSWMGYSLDGQETVTVTGNTTLAGLSWGLHNVTVYAKDLLENTGNSDTVWFSTVEPFPTTLVAVASGASIAIIGIGLLIYFKKRKR
jgi:hypothetical protein